MFSSDASFPPNDPTPDPRSPGEDVARGGKEGEAYSQAVDEATEARTHISQAFGAGKKNVRKVPEAEPSEGV